MDKTTPTVLIVDDDKFMVEIVYSILSKMQYEIFKAYSPSEMWDILEAVNVDLILLDILFPGGETAFDHLPELKKRFPSTGVVLISGKKEREVILRALREGVLDFVPKPIQEDEVEFVIRNAFKRVQIIKENERLTRSLMDRIRLMRLLLDASNSINSSLEMGRILERVLESTREIFECEGSSVLIYEPSEDALIFHTVIGGSEKVRSVKLRKDQGIAGWCFTNRRPVVVEDAYSDPRFTNLADSKSGFKTRNLVAVPIIKGDGSAIGVLELINLKDMKRFKEENYLDALVTLANQIAGALERAQLMKEVLSVNKELDRMNMELEDKVLEKTKELRAALEELKATQDKLVYTEKIAAIGELAAGIAHELNNALGYVSSNFFTMQEYLQELGDVVRAIKNCSSNADCHKVKEKLQDKDIDFILEDTPNLIKESSKGIEHVKKIIQGLKLLSRVDRGELELASINDLLKDSVEFAHTKLKYVPEVDVKLTPMPKIHCYPHRLSQVFINILNNAADAVNDKKDGKVEVRTWEDDEYQYVSIKDNGEGIPQENLRKIFDPFFTTKAPGKGTGLGLSISYSIIQDHYGDIEVHSEEGKGTEFVIKIPKNLKEIVEAKENK